ncbi:chromosome partitioning ATPase [Rivibacter subsaxonicus]|uniref:Receptor protein-tyrosine kinase n=1 Tax=Rivibacter subsaxonicus TaxID=457575 RepID=A0A4Q7VVR6_9BURK|nr:chromosome partitioning ATPase [Rivibacter subsaxonicus]RZU00774.1 receptor protein-tyrosine kinase [Rivibacter subsaxonicus]
MSLIEQATKRLEELSRAGVAVPWAQTGLTAPTSKARVAQETGANGVHRGVADDAQPPASPEGVHVLPGAARRLAPLEPAPTIEIDLEALQRGGFLTPDAKRSVLAEEMRHVKRALLRNMTQPPQPTEISPALILVTSAVPGEGKTFSAINLALSLAVEIDTSVVLVDADFLRPNVLDRLGVRREARGLLDALADPDLDPAQLVLATNLPKLSILPTGTAHPRAAELLSSTGMDRLLLALTEAHPGRVVIFDAPPLLVTAAGAALAARMGQVLMVVEAGRTSRHLVAQAFAAVEHCPIVLAVLNKTSGGGIGGYGYGDYYG